MKLKFIIAFLPLFLGCNLFSQTLQPACGQGYFYKIGGCLSSYSTGNGTLTGYTQNYPGNAQGIALGPAFGFSAPNPTYWTVVNGVYYYYNGTSFVSSGHSAGGNAFTNPGGSRDFIYNLDGQGNVSVYDGTGNASILATFSSLTSTNVVQDIVGDINNNFYLVRNASPAAVLVFDYTGALTCTYAISPPSGATNGLAITGNRLFIGDALSAYDYELRGKTLVNTGYTGLTPCQGTSNDLASCPSEAGLFSGITATPGALACTLTSVTLTSGDANGSTTYMWSGPGISGASNTQSIAVTAPGIYTRSAINCAGLSSTMYYTIKYDSTPPPLSFTQSSKIKCVQDPAVMLSAGGLFSSYKWSPDISLSNTTTSIVYANPSVTTVYTVTGYVNGCERSAAITVSANPLSAPLITVSSGTICQGNSVSLNVPALLNYEWQPGNLPGNNIVVNPQINTEYTVTATDELGCKINATQKIAVVAFPTLNSSFSRPEICKDESVTLTSAGAEKYFVMPGNHSGASLILAPLSTTVYTITGSNWNCAVTKTLEIVVNKLPVISVTVGNKLVCAGDPVEVEVNGALTYSWDDQPGASIQVLYPTVNSVYKIKGVDANGCSSELLFSPGVSACTSLRDVAPERDIIIYPNPATAFLIVENQFTGSCIVEIFDLQGRVLLSTAVQSGINKVQLGAMPAGLYLVRVSNGTQIVHKAMVAVQ